MRDLRVLKTYANYSMCDPNNLADWLADIDPRFRQYTYSMLQSGVGRTNLLQITDEQLQRDCCIENGIHRAQILAAARRPARPCFIDSQCTGPDVFISYRRTTGSQLARSELTPIIMNIRLLQTSFIIDWKIDWAAIGSDCNLLCNKMFYILMNANNLWPKSWKPRHENESVCISLNLYWKWKYLFSFSLLKVHLQVRGFSVFIDVEKLEAGKFEEKLISSVQRARNFILVLSANALDKCMGDTGMKDWVHKVRLFLSTFNVITCTSEVRTWWCVWSAGDCHRPQRKEEHCSCHRQLSVAWSQLSSWGHASRPHI